MEQAFVILRNREIPDIRQMATYLQDGGYEAWKRALKEMTADQVIDVVKASGLRGRGGAGFPAGVKWSFVPKNVFPKYVVVNGDESEPGTFKDREIIEKNPHQLIEGVALCAYAIQAEAAYIYLRGEFKRPARILQAAIDEAHQAGLLGHKIQGSNYSLNMYVHLGAGAYICGEETALLESLEGKLGQPRLRPPFPANVGLYAKPTVINNVETLANVPPIVRNGADWYRRYGTEKSPGTKIFCLSGMVKRPGNYEVPLGKIKVRDLIFGEEFGQGLLAEGRTVKGVLPAGASAPVLPESALDTLLDYESVAAAGSMLGSASFIIMDNTVDMVWAATKMVHFFKHESCGKCTPCREGTYWMLNLLEKIGHGHGEQRDVMLLGNVAQQMLGGKCFCLLGDFSTSPVLSTLKHFRNEYDAKVQLAPD
ncbi:MAG: NADH-quinone oxidoreductase subunit NuoF, partial [Chloroflexi bacterium]|nr:NADH-quinone oxidoreductase subunit NuoF [Chloroflexota bacterium]